MDREVVSAINLSVAIIFLAAFLNIVFFTTYLGSQIQNEGFLCIDSLRNDIAQSFLSDLVGEENRVSAATAYNIMKSYSAAITGLEIRMYIDPETGEYMQVKDEDGIIDITGLIDKFIWLTDNLKGMVKLQVAWDGVAEGYVVIIHKGDCGGFHTSYSSSAGTYVMEWEESRCTCGD